VPVQAVEVEEVEEVEEAVEVEAEVEAILPQQNL
jgi:hypothetical protein